jgi:hypothetical protein
MLPSAINALSSRSRCSYVAISSPCSIAAITRLRLAVVSVASAGLMQQSLHGRAQPSHPIRTDLPLRAELGASIAP